MANIERASTKGGTMTEETIAVRIGDREIDPNKRPAIDVYNPADLREVIDSVPALSADDIADAYAAAATAQHAWDRQGLLARASILYGAANLIRSEADRLTRLIVHENGKLWAEATVEVAKTADFFEYYASFGRQAYGSLLPDARANTQTSFRREPIGVVLLITPWNDPLLTPARKLAPALISGNAAVLKPSTDTPLIALALTDLLLRAGLPSGVLTVVTGRGSEISQALLEAPELRAVSFTGSTSIGNQLRAALANRSVRVQTEMGGKNAGVVFDSADLDSVVDTVTQAAFAQAGQRCTATSRLVVSAGMADDVVDALRASINRFKPGPGLDRSSTFGPVINARQSSEILDYVATARNQGATVVTGGDSLTEGALVHGAFVAPTILDNVAIDHTVWKEEIFGPVLSVHRLDARGSDFYDAAVQLTNGSRYGLSASIFTNDLGQALQFAEDANTGQVSVNLPTSGWDVHHPFGGFADSGSAFKEQGEAALTFYTRTKTVAIHYAVPRGTTSTPG